MEDIDRGCVVKRLERGDDSLDGPLSLAHGEVRRDLNKLFMMEADQQETAPPGYDQIGALEEPHVDLAVSMRSRANRRQTIHSTGPSPVIASSKSGDREQEDQADTGLSAALPRGLLFGCSFAAALWVIVAAVVALFMR
jgi:hypothetical protein